MNTGEIITLAAAGGFFAKIAVDLYKKSRPGHSWELPLLAVLFGIGVVFLLLLDKNEVITGQLAARAVLAGLLAGAGAVGVTELHKDARKDEPHA